MFFAAGTLGLVMESTVYGPEVFSLGRNSPLSGFMKKGDLLLQIQGVNVRNMTSTQAAKLLTGMIGEERA